MSDIPQDVLFRNLENIQKKHSTSLAADSIAYLITFNFKKLITSH